MADTNRFKSDDDIREDEITCVKDRLMIAFDSMLSSHGISLDPTSEDLLGAWIWDKLDKRGPLSD